MSKQSMKVERLGEGWTTIQARELADLRCALRIAAGYISASPGFTDKHPEEVLDWLMTEAEAVRNAKE